MIANGLKSMQHIITFHGMSSFSLLLYLTMMVSTYTRKKCEDEVEWKRFWELFNEIHDRESNKNIDLGYNNIIIVCMNCSMIYS